MKKMVCAPKENSNQPACPNRRIRVFAKRSMGSQGFNDFKGQLRLLSDCVDEQGDLSLRVFVGQI